MILVIALIVLGPDKLPSAARRIGAMWSEFNRWRTHLETEVRAAFPDLPSTTEIAQAVRSPITMLDRLADEHGATTVGARTGHDAGAGPASADPARAEPDPAGTPTARPVPPVDARADPDVSLMN
jgi:Sec-independent protein translocase protein TatA